MPPLKHPVMKSLFSVEYGVDTEVPIISDFIKVRTLQNVKKTHAICEKPPLIGFCWGESGKMNQFCAKPR